MYILASGPLPPNKYLSTVHLILNYADSLWDTCTLEQFPFRKSKETGTRAKGGQAFPRLSVLCDRYKNGRWKCCSSDPKLVNMQTLMKLSTIHNVTAAETMMEGSTSLEGARITRGSEEEHEMCILLKLKFNVIWQFAFYSCSFKTRKDQNQ